MHPLEHVIARLRTASVVTDPYPHYTLDDLFPNDYYDELLRNLPESDVYENLYEVTDLKLDHFRHRDQRDLNRGWTASLDADRKRFWDDFHDWFLSSDLARAALESFASGPWPEVSVESQLIRHRAGYFLGPHSDANTKLVVLLLYLPQDDTALHLGTSIYRPNDASFTCAKSAHYPFSDFTRVKTAPYKRNSLLAFRRSDRSFHGVEPLTEGDGRRDVIQYVVYDKAARERQLQARKRKIAFVCGEKSGEALRASEAVGKIGRVCLITGISAPAELSAAVRRFGDVERIVTAQETLLEPVAIANEALGLPGMPAATVRRVLDKSQLKATLRAAGIRTPRELAQPEFPMIVKPLNGSGGLATWRIRNQEHLDRALALMPKPFVAEEFLDGEELCVDTITIDDEPRIASVCHYRPSILDAIEDPSVQWTCIIPREQDANIIEQGIRAVRALKVGNAVTHMEGVLLPDGEVAFIDATLRPAGARIGPMFGYAYDIDHHFAWARAAIDGCFDGPWERKYAVGTIFLRGASHVVDNEHIVDAQWPKSATSSTYTGDGYVTVRHPSTAVVEETLRSIAQQLRNESQPPLSWRERLQFAEKQLYKPAWEANRDSSSA